VMKHPRLKDSIKRIVLAQVGAKKDLVGYNHWLANNFPDFIEQMKLKELSDALQYHPLISIVVPTYNTDIDFLRECLDSVRAQIYQNWELCIVDDASPNQIVRDEIMAYAKQDERINYKFLKTNQHISGATNGAVKLATGEFISLLDHDDILWPNALYEVVKALNADPKLDFLYTDEDKITEDRHEHLGPFFKPDWNPDFLHSVNYITHFTTIRKSVYEAVGGLRKEYNGAQDWDLFMRITSMTDKVYHIPKIVYSWRIHDLSTAKNTDAKPYVVAAQKQALTDDVIRRGHKNAVIEQDKKHTGYWHVSYAVEGEPLVSIVIPSKNQYKIVKRCVESIYAKTSYKNFEIILVDTGSTDQKVHRWYKAMIKSHTNFKLVDWPEQPFSYSRSCNRGAEVAQGEFVVMLNNDTEVLTHNWIELMLGDAQRPEIGAVGCLLFFPDGYHIQHAGVGVGLGGAAANSFSMMTLDRPMSQTQHLMLNTKHNMTAVTAACLMMRKQLFTDIEGFDDKLRVTYNDVDLCLRLYDAGYQNVYTPYVRLLHHESISVGLPEEIKKRDTTEFKAAQNLFKKRWAKYIKHDPNVNPNLSKDNAFYDLD
jgi:GT2 family glycosyltransferase